MTGLLTRLIGRIPIGWLQLTHNRGRLFAAVAGVSFANILVLVQLGIMGSLNTSIVRDYEMFAADIMISSADTNTLTEGSDVPRQLMLRALSVPGVAAASPLYIGTVEYTDDAGDVTAFQAIGVDPDTPGVLVDVLDQQRDLLRLENNMLIDTATRGLESERLSEINPDSPRQFTISNQLMTAVGTLSVGGGFAGDGTIIVSDQTFLRLFPRRSSAAPNHVLVVANESRPVQAIEQQIAQLMPQRLAQVRTVEQAAIDDQIYQTTERPTGLIFGFGVVMGVIVGIVIVYQVLSTDVADHLREYATFKAMGYPQSFFLGVVFEEAVILAILGFVPGFMISLASYIALNQLTGLPMYMTWDVALMVFVGTVLACSLSGAIATRRLASADPADLF